MFLRVRHEYIPCLPQTVVMHPNGVLNRYVFVTSNCIIIISKKNPPKN